MTTAISIVDRAVANFQTWRMRHKIKNNLKKSIVFSAEKFFAEQGIQTIDRIPSPEYFPSLPLHLSSFADGIKSYAQEHGASQEKPVEVVIAVGDSISEFFNGHSKNIDDRLNFGIAGACWPHFQLVIAAVAPILEQNGLRVRAMLLGCGGNGLLGYQSWSGFARDGRECFLAARRTFAFARIMMYGLPPVFDPYATILQDTARIWFKALVASDANAVYLDILARFGGGFFGLFPKAWLSVDGTHMTAAAQFEFDGMITTGLTAQSWSTI